MPNPLIRVLRYWLVWAAICGVTAAMGQEQLDGQPKTDDRSQSAGQQSAVVPTPGDSTQAVTDTTVLLTATPPSWQPAPTDTVWTAVIATVPSLGEAQASYDQLADTGKVAFARIRATFARYWYELLLGPWPHAAALDSAVAAHPPALGVLYQPSVAATWESASRGTVASPSQIVAVPGQPPHSAAPDSGLGDQRR